MRTFIALDVPDEIRARISQYLERVRPLAPDARWAKPESLHVTLKFVGEANDSLLEKIKDALKDIKSVPLRIRLEGVGYFPSQKSARVFWAGVHATDSLPHLATSIDLEMAKLGIEPEKNPYRPHLTLARAGSARGVRLLFSEMQRRLESEAAPHFGTMTAQEFFLYQSRLSPKGATYVRLERFSLA
ncbi:MAG TPA: RNA 2',3'-cyclic phosphodiesterase [Verrucomicrobiae bacterium]|jgi:2'-5' RNA ligase|nr:RNA 2',3'-cyclic phosphodiesterase [Verrucomicrobiae bacterium]